MAHWAYLWTLGALVLNFVGSAAIAGGADASRGEAVAYSILNLVLLSVVGLWGFHNGYKGLATGNGRSIWVFVSVTSVLMLYSLIAMLVGASLFHGWTGIPEARSDGSFSSFWVAWINIESVAWLVSLLFHGVSLWLVLSHRSTARAARSGRQSSRV